MDVLYCHPCQIVSVRSALQRSHLVRGVAQTYRVDVFTRPGICMLFLLETGTCPELVDFLQNRHS